MQASKIVAAVLSISIVGGTAVAVAKGGEKSVASARENVCSNPTLAMADQDACRTEMKSANSQVAKQQVATRYQSKIDTAAATGSSAQSTAAGGTSSAPTAGSATPDSQPMTPSAAAPSPATAPSSPAK